MSGPVYCSLDINTIRYLFSRRSSAQPGIAIIVYYWVRDDGWSRPNRLRTQGQSLKTEVLSPRKTVVWSAPIILQTAGWNFRGNADWEC